MDCVICGTPDEDKPMCFKGLDYCSEWHRKELEMPRSETKKAEAHNEG